MDAFQKIGLGNNKRSNKEYLTAEVLKATTEAIIGLKFNYSLVTSSDYSIATSALPGQEYVSVTEQIRTTRVDIPFAEEDKIILQDGRIMSVVRLEKEDYPERALISKSTQIAWIITLEGY